MTTGVGANRGCAQGDCSTRIYSNRFDPVRGAIGQHDETGNNASKTTGGKPKFQINNKQRWVLARLAENGTLTRCDVEQEFDISDRAAKRVLGELSDAGLIEFDRTTHPGFYRFKQE